MSDNFPIILGRGKGLFAESSAPIAFELTDHLVTSSGVVFSYYQRVLEMKTGRLGEYKCLNSFDQHAHLQYEDIAQQDEINFFA